LKDPCWSVFTIDGLELETSAYSGQLRWAIDHPGYLLPFHGFFEVKWSTTYGLGGKLGKMGHKLWFKMMLTFFPSHFHTGSVLVLSSTGKTHPLHQTQKRSTTNLKRESHASS